MCRGGGGGGRCRMKEEYRMWPDVFKYRDVGLPVFTGFLHPLIPPAFKILNNANQKSIQMTFCIFFGKIKICFGL